MAFCHPSQHDPHACSIDLGEIACVQRKLLCLCFGVIRARPERLQLLGWDAPGQPLHLTRRGRVRQVWHHHDVGVFFEQGNKFLVDLHVAHVGRERIHPGTQQPLGIFQIVDVGYDPQAVLVGFIDDRAIQLGRELFVNPEHRDKMLIFSKKRQSAKVTKTIMAQVKKSKRRRAILASAARLFRKKGYLKCRMEEIAADAGTAVANLYVYFPSKLHLFYAVWTPMLQARMLKLGEDAREIVVPKDRLRFIFANLWRDIPRENNAFAKNLMQAVASTPGDVEKPHEILQWCEEFLSALIEECLPPKRKYVASDTNISFLSWMAFDGFTVNVGMDERRDMDTLVGHFVDLLVGESYAKKK